MLPLLKGLSEAMIPEGLASPRPPHLPPPFALVRAGRGRSPRSLRAALAQQSARGQRGARGRVRAQSSFAFTCSTRWRTRLSSTPLSRSVGTSGLGVLPRAPPRLPESGFQPLSPGPALQVPGAPFRAPCPPSPRRGPKASLSSLSSRRALSPGNAFRSPITGRRWGGAGAAREAEAGGAVGQPQAGAGCAPRPRRVRPAEAALRAVRRVRGAPAAIQLPGLISSLGARLGAGSQRAAAAPRARPRGRSRGRRRTRAARLRTQVSGRWGAGGSAV